jgi:hypothetical protein
VQAEAQDDEDKQYGDLLPVLLQCTRLFEDDHRYKNNKKYLRMWIIYADLCETPEDVFNTLTSKQIGVGLAMYYQAYTIVVENQGQWDLADQLYMQGIKAQATPLDSLIEAYMSFKERWVTHKQEQSTLKRTIAGQAGPQAKKQALNHAVAAPAPAPAPAPGGSNTVASYKDEVIRHPTTGEEICFEEYRAICFAARAAEKAAAAASKATTQQQVKAPRIALAPHHSPIKLPAQVPQVPAVSPGDLNVGLESFLAPSPPRVQPQHDSNAIAKEKATSSPTIHTKTALKEVFSMFTSPGFSSSSLTDEIGGPKAQNDKVPSPQRRGHPSPVAFTIFCDDDQDNTANQPGPGAGAGSGLSSSSSWSNEAVAEQENQMPPVTPGIAQQVYPHTEELTPILETSGEELEVSPPSVSIVASRGGVYSRLTCTYDTVP